jgi:RNA polymerase sigma factor (sigma-70 family)
MIDRTKRNEFSNLIDNNGEAPSLTASQVADFIQRHRSELSRFILRKLGSEEQVPDILHDTFLRMADSQTAGTADNPRAFVFRIVANLIIDFQRRSVNRLSHEIDEQTWQTLPENRSGPEIHYQQRQRLDAINKALAELPEPCRLAFYLNRIEGCSHSEIAERMKISESMVAKHLARAMKHCRDRLRHY